MRCLIESFGFTEWAVDIVREIAIMRNIVFAVVDLWLVVDHLRCWRYAHLAQVQDLRARYFTCKAASYVLWVYCRIEILNFDLLPTVADWRIRFLIYRLWFDVQLFLGDHWAGFCGDWLLPVVTHQVLGADIARLRMIDYPSSPRARLDGLAASSGLGISQ